MLLEWTDPPYAPGHWVPEMVTLAGGEPVLGRPGSTSVRVTWDDVRAAAPDVVVAAPCGYDLAGATALADDLVASGVLPDGVPVHPVDANAAWARPGTRLVDGVEELAALLHPMPSERHAPPRRETGADRVRCRSATPGEGEAGVPARGAAAGWRARGCRRGGR